MLKSSEDRAGRNNETIKRKNEWHQWTEYLQCCGCHATLRGQGSCGFWQCISVSKRHFLHSACLRGCNMDLRKEVFSSSSKCPGTLERTYFKVHCKSPCGFPDWKLRKSQQTRFHMEKQPGYELSKIAIDLCVGWPKSIATATAGPSSKGRVTSWGDIRRLLCKTFFGWWKHEMYSTGQGISPLGKTRAERS